jgi:ubiquinone/menaquinone biosynthesis C-methylase UbiE
VTARVGTGALDEEVELRQQLASKIDYDRPRKGGDAIFDLIGDFRGRTVLDVGCGLGVFREHVERIGAAWIGLDLFGGCCSVLGDMDHLPFRDGTFDGVLCSAVFEHMPDPCRTVSEMRRVLKDGGKLFGYVAFLEPFHGLSYYHMSHKGLEHLLASNGFRPLHIFPAQNGTAFQLESMLFPKYVPFIQPMFRRISQWLFRAVLLMNRILRGLLRLARGQFGAADRENRQMYGRLLRLRFASGFNFVAERCDDVGERQSGYVGIVR